MTINYLTYNKLSSAIHFKIVAKINNLQITSKNVSVSTNLPLHLNFVACQSNHVRGRVLNFWTQKLTRQIRSSAGIWNNTFSSHVSAFTFLENLTGVSCGAALHGTQVSVEKSKQIQSKNRRNFLGQQFSPNNSSLSVW